MAKIIFQPTRNSRNINSCRVKEANYPTVNDHDNKSYMILCKKDASDILKLKKGLKKGTASNYITFLKFKYNCKNCNLAIYQTTKTSHNVRFTRCIGRLPPKRAETLYFRNRCPI